MPGSAGSQQEDENFLLLIPDSFERRCWFSPHQLLALNPPQNPPPKTKKAVSLLGCSFFHGGLFPLLTPFSSCDFSLVLPPFECLPQVSPSCRNFDSLENKRSNRAISAQHFGWLPLLFRDVFFF